MYKPFASTATLPARLKSPQPWRERCVKLELRSPHYSEPGSEWGCPGPAWREADLLPHFCVTESPTERKSVLQRKRDVNRYLGASLGVQAVLGSLISPLRDGIRCRLIQFGPRGVQDMQTGDVAILLNHCVESDRPLFAIHACRYWICRLRYILDLPFRASRAIRPEGGRFRRVKVILRRLRQGRDLAELEFHHQVFSVEPAKCSWETLARPFLELRVLLPGGSPRKFAGILFRRVLQHFPGSRVETERFYEPCFGHILDAVRFGPLYTLQ